ncbi:MAG: hypothetical protein HKN20_07190 [Gemmatimonadetes bacterium]|nr:hypothetical protein [Gemmatimonadota bacterium]
MSVHARRIALAILVTAAALTGCTKRGPETIGIGEVSKWETYTNEQVGYTFQYPAEFEARDHHEGRDVVLRYKGYQIVAINYCDEEEARARGLWADAEPEGQIELSGRTGRLYRYQHQDTFTLMPCISFVVPHRDRSLGLEFRREGELDAVMKRIRQTFRFL